MDYSITKKITLRNQSNQLLINPRGVEIHSTATPNATDENENTYFNNNNVGANAHAFVDYDSITQNVETRNQAWGAGPTANSKYLMIELCEFDDPEKFRQTWLRAVWLTAYWLRNVVGTNAVDGNTVPAHADTSKWWHETDHTDPIAYFAKHGKTMDDFRHDVNTLLNVPVEDSVPTTPATNVNTDVLHLQQMLNKLKMRDGKGNKLAEDGIIGTCTKEAVKRFQSICGLTVDGIAGMMTWTAINAIFAKPLLKVSSSGLVVRYLQYRVSTPYDGSFGWNTNRAVAIWQGQNGLGQDGIVGPNTWAKLLV